MAQTGQRSEKWRQAEATLPASLHDPLAELVADYTESAERHVGRVFVNYNILADLLRAGWRKGS